MDHRLISSFPKINFVTSNKNISVNNFHYRKHEHNFHYRKHVSVFLKFDVLPVMTLFTTYNNFFTWSE